MTIKTDDVPNISVARGLNLAVGGAASLVARKNQLQHAELLCRFVEERVKDEKNFKQSVCRIMSSLCIDSDSWDAAMFEAQFANINPEIVTRPANYERMTSPSGRTIIEKLETPPFGHLRRWKQNVSVLQEKGGQSEAESIRVYGAGNTLINIRTIWAQVERAVKTVKDANKTDDWSKLVEHGFKMEDGVCRYNVFFSTAGGQGSGSIVILLGLLALLLDDERENSIVNVHFLMPGFHAKESDMKEFDDTKTFAVIRDLALLKINAPTLHIPFPDKDKIVKPHQTSQVFDHLFVHEPIRGDGKDAYKAFIHRVSETVLSIELSAFAESLRRARSNASARARLRVA